MRPTNLIFEKKFKKKINEKPVKVNLIKSLIVDFKTEDLLKNLF